MNAELLRRLPTREEILAELEALRREHLVLEEDCWYSCPASGRCCNYEAKSGSTACDCGADEHNARIDRLVGALQVPA